MHLTTLQTLAIILAVAAGTQLTRWLPFWLFPETRQPPAAIVYLGRVLPPAMMGLLVVYCLKGVSWLSAPHGAPELLAIAAVVGLHTWKRNVLLSIAGSKDLGIQEINDAADLVANAVDPEANIIFGTVVDESLGDQVRITVIATGFSDANVGRQDQLFQASTQKSEPVSAPAQQSKQSSSTRTIGGTEVPNFGNDQFELPDFLKRGNF